MPALAVAFFTGTAFAQKRVYLAPDDHTDFIWSATETEYTGYFTNMLDYYLDQADATTNNISRLQSRFSTDGSYWLRIYELNKTPAQFDRLLARIKDGHIGSPLTPLVVTWGGVPAEAALRAMYYPGRLERRYNFRFTWAQAMENSTFPFGLVSLWSGAGAQYAWHGVCACTDTVPGQNDRPREIYRWTGLDGQSVILKWFSFVSNDSLGGYAEARYPGTALDYVTVNANANGFNTRFPYGVVGIFGQGWDDRETLNTNILAVAAADTDTNREVHVSNVDDFFRDFATNYPAALTNFNASFGNEWDVSAASLAEVSAIVKRNLEKLRAAEALASLVSFQIPGFARDTNTLAQRDQAFLDFGLYFEHDFGEGGPGATGTERRAWERRTAAEIELYVTNLLANAQSRLGGLIPKSSTNNELFAFNPLSWPRDDIADLPFTNTTAVHIVDRSTGLEAPSQIVTNSGVRYLRVLAANVPAVGYKVFEIQSGAGTNFPLTASASISGSKATLTNEFYSVVVTNRGAIVSLVDKTRGNREFIKQVNKRYANDLTNGSGTLTIESSGPVSVTVLATDTALNAPVKHQSRITFQRGLARVEIRDDLQQNFGNTERSYAFSFALTNFTLRHEEVGAVLTARLLPDGGHYSPTQARYEYLSFNHFADVTSGDNFGLTLANWDAFFLKFGNSTKSLLDTNTAQIAAIAGGQLLGYGMDSQAGDSQFTHRFALRPHGGYDQTAAMKFALEYQNPFVAGVITGGAAYPETNFSLLNISDTNVLLWAVKPSEEGITNGLIARVWNVATNATSFTLTLPYPLTAARRTTHLETDLTNAPTGSNFLTASIAPVQMETFRLFPQVSISKPALIFNRSGGSNFLVWPNWAANYQLESATNLQPFVGWQPLTNSPSVSNQTFQLPVNFLEARRFYRLRQTN